MIIKPKSNRTKGIIASSFMVFALIAQPMYGLVASQVAKAVGGVTYHVASDGSGTDCTEVAPCATITEAINKASTNDTIQVASGTYTEALSINKSISIVGAGQDVTFIKAPESFSNGGDLVNITGAGVSAGMKNLTVGGASNSYISEGAGIHVHNGANAVIGNVKVADVLRSPATELTLYGIRVGGNTVGTATISNSTVTNYQRGGIYVVGSGSFATITNNNILAGSGLPGLTNGISLQYDANAVITGNTVNGNTYSGSRWSGSGISVWDGANTTTIVRNNTVTGNQVGIVLSYANNVDILTNIDATGSTGNQTNARAENSVADWPTPTKVYVDSAWSSTLADSLITLGGSSIVMGYNAFASLQDAANAVASAGTIELRSNITTNSQTTLSKPNVIFNGNGHTIVNNRDNTAKDNSNNSTIGIQANGVTVNNLTIDGTGGVWMHGINAYEATGVALNSVTLQNNSNAGLIVGKDSNVTVRDITTKDNGWYGINVDRKAGTSSTLTVLGTSSHNEDSKAHIWIDDRSASGNTVNDPNAQYARYWEGNGYKYLLDRTKPTAELTVAPFNPSSFGIKATDDQRLTRIDYSLWKDNDTTQIGVWGHTVDWNDRNSFEKTFTQYCDHGGNHNNPCVTKNFTSDLADGTYQLRATATDVMDKQTNAETREFTVDRTPPAAPSFQVNGKTDPSYTNQLQATAKWNKPNADVVKYVYSYCNDIVGNAYNCTTGNSYTEEVTGLSRTGDFDQGEGVHHMKVQAVDGAGNPSAWSNVVTVTYDKTAPTVKITSAEQSSTSGVEFKGYVFDTNFEHYYCWLTGPNGNEIKNTRNSNCVTTWASDIHRNGNPNTQDVTGGGSDSNPVRLGGFDVSNVASGNYTINIIGVDRAGNKSEPSTTDISVDRTPPTISINEAGPFNMNRPIITGTVSEDATKVEVSIDGGKNWIKLTNFNRGDQTWSYTYTKDLANGEHTILARATDSTGNTGTTELVFKVDITTSTGGTGTSDTDTQTSSGGALVAPVTTTPTRLAILQATTNPTAIAANTAEDATADDEEVLGTSTTSERERSASVLAATDNKDEDKVEWSIVNAIAAVITVLVSIIALAGISKKQGRGKTLSIVTIVPAIGAVVAFFMLENLSSPMVFLNAWSWLFVGVLAVQVFIFAMTKQKSSDNE